MIVPPQKVPGTLLVKLTILDISMVKVLSPAVNTMVAMARLLCVDNATVTVARELLNVKFPVRAALDICTLVTPVIL